MTANTPIKACSAIVPTINPPLRLPGRTTLSPQKRLLMSSSNSVPASRQVWGDRSRGASDRMRMICLGHRGGA